MGVSCSSSGWSSIPVLPPVASASSTTLDEPSAAIPASSSEWAISGSGSRSIEGCKGGSTVASVSTSYAARLLSSGRTGRGPESCFAFSRPVSKLFTKSMLNPPL
jgi:hypothetical protein